MSERQSSVDLNEF